MTELSKRDLFLIEQGFKAGDSQHYENYEIWLNDVVDGYGHTVNHYVAAGAEKLAED